MSFPKTFVCLWFELKKYTGLKNEPNIQTKKKVTSLLPYQDQTKLKDFHKVPLSRMVLLCQVPC